jgi:putative membrane protein
MLSTIDKDRITEAVTKAEENSSGEIVCALATEVSTYREVPLAWAAAVALAAPPIALALGVRPLTAGDGGLWLIAQASSIEWQLTLALVLYASLQIVLFLVVALVVHIPAVRRRLTPRSLKAHRVAQAAQHHFAAVSARTTDSDTGVLIFVALIDRQVQILADAAIHQKCGDAVWTRAAQAIAKAMRHGADPTGGIVEAIEICGAALREHFPADGARAHAYPSRPIEV